MPKRKKSTANGLVKSAKPLDMKQLVQDTAYALDAFAAQGSDDLLGYLGLSRQQVYQAVMSDDEVDACREDVVSALLASTWRLYGDDTDDVQMDKLYKCIRQNLPAIAEQVVVAKLCGYAVARLVYKQDEDGFVSLSRVISRHDELDRYVPKFDRLVYNGVLGEETADTEFAHLFLTNKATSKNPAGEMAVVRIYPAVMLRREGWRYAYQFTQRYAQPYLVAKTQGDKDAAAQTVSRFKNGGAAAIDVEEELQMLQNAATGEFFRLLEQMANARIQKSVLGRVKTSELANGSRSAQKVEQDTQRDRIDAYLNLMATAVQHIVDALVALNAYYATPIQVSGSLWFEYASEIKVDKDRAERDAKYLATGKVELTEAYYTDVLGFEPEHFRVVSDAKGGANLPLSVRLSDGQDPVQLSADQKIMQPKIQAILSAAAQANSYAEFERLLGGLDLSAGDQILIDRLVYQNSQVVADGMEGKA
ncbi:phage portal protein family protein [Conchiformibius steedae]|uniref:DUF935 family protein n=1 Tax=Conchiformibius steedae TaxID=153493 RepID=A0A3P2A771_9NEIS|nr:hypothetical protein [Conchiformibius steedae]RRD90100.1 hypothetical protein EII21_06695 [Conchiformibius steedae]